MQLFLVVLVLLVVGVVAAVVTGAISGGLDDPATTVPPSGLPEGRISAADIDGLRFAPAVRGYRMDQVDAAMAALRAELLARDVDRQADEPQEAEPTW